MQNRFLFMMLLGLTFSTQAFAMVAVDPNEPPSIVIGENCTLLGRTTLATDNKAIAACLLVGTATECGPTGDGCRWKTMTQTTEKCYDVIGHSGGVIGADGFPGPYLPSAVASAYSTGSYSTAPIIANFPKYASIFPIYGAVLGVKCKGDFVRKACSNTTTMSDNGCINAPLALGASITITCCHPE